MGVFVAFTTIIIITISQHAKQQLDLEGSTDNCLLEEDYRP